MTDEATKPADDALTCPKCGSVFRGAARERLHRISHPMTGGVSRRGGRVCLFLACLCELDSFGHVELRSTGMPVPVGGSRTVIVTNYGSAVVVGRTPKLLRLRLRASNQLVTFNAVSGRRWGGKSRGYGSYYLSDEELAIAIRIADGLAKTAGKDSKGSDG